MNSPIDVCAVQTPFDVCICLLCCKVHFAPGLFTVLRRCCAAAASLPLGHHTRTATRAGLNSASWLLRLRATCRTSSIAFWVCRPKAAYRCAPFSTLRVEDGLALCLCVCCRRPSTSSTALVVPPLVATNPAVTAVVHLTTRVKSRSSTGLVVLLPQYTHRGNQTCAPCKSTGQCSARGMHS